MYLIERLTPWKNIENLEFSQMFSKSTEKREFLWKLISKKLWENLKKIPSSIILLSYIVGSRQAKWIMY